MDINFKFASAGALFGGIAVILGAFGAHALKEILNSDSLASFNTGVRYQMYHALLLIALSPFANSISATSRNAIFYLLVIGIVLFSFSIYLLNMSRVWEVNMKWLGPITPIGGLLLIAAWTLMFVSFIRK